MAQTWFPSFDSTDCAGLRSKGSLLTDFQVAPLSFDTSTPPAVAAYHSSVPKVMSFTRKAAIVGTACFCLGTGRFAGIAPFLPLVAGATAVATTGSGTYIPVRSHLCAASSYFIQPPLLREAHQPLGEA